MSVLRAFPAFRAAAYAERGKGALKSCSRRGAWGVRPGLLWTRPIARSKREYSWPKKSSLLVSPPTQDVAVHVRDYLRFTQMFKWSALVCLVIGFIVLMILK